MKLRYRKGSALTMNNKRRTGFSDTFNICLALLLFLLLPYTANSEVPKAKAPDSSRVQKEELLCRQIQDKIKKNQEIQKTVRTSIQMGYDACGVIKCAIKGNGDLKQIIEGAVEAGTTKDVVSRCALDACEATQVRAKEPDLKRVQKEELLCGQIQDNIRKHQDIRKIVMESIQTGNDVCGVIKCSLKGGGDWNISLQGRLTLVMLKILLRAVLLHVQRISLLF